MEDIPTVEPIDIPQYKYKNSKYEILPKLPARMIAVASSTGGKSVLIQNLILKIFTPHSTHEARVIQLWRMDVLSAGFGKFNFQEKGVEPWNPTCF